MFHRGLVAGASWALLCGGLLAQEQAAPQDAASSAATDESAAAGRFQMFAETAAGLDFRTLGSEHAYGLDATPLLKFSSEGTVFGSLFLWRDVERRMAVIGTIGSLPINRQDFEFIELHLLKPQAIHPVAIVGQPTKTWNPDVATLRLQPVPDAPAVAPSAAVRLAQMHSLAREFQGVMRHDGQSHQLRLLPQPLFRYDDSTPKLDGALFAMVWDVGTDPEMLAAAGVDRSRRRAPLALPADSIYVARGRPVSRRPGRLECPGVPGT